MNRCSHVNIAARSAFTPLILLAAIATGSAALADLPAEPNYRIVRPSNTGIPGYVDMNFVEFAPDGRMWTTARDFFWQQGGVAALDFSTGIWKTYSSEETPLYQENMSADFAADGSVWIGGRGGVIARLHPDGETFTAYTPASTGVLVDGAYESISIAPDGHVWASNPGQVDLGGGLFEFDGTSWTKHEEPWMTTWTGFGYAPCMSVIARSNGDVWATFISSPQRMGLYRDGAWTVFQPALGQPYILDYAEDTDGTLYGVGAFGCYKLNDATNQWQQIGTIGSSRIALDPNNDFIYITSSLTSVARYNGSTWTTFASFPGWVDAIQVAPNGDVWIAAETYATHWDLHHYNASGQIQRVYNRSNTGMPTYFPPWIYRDRDGMMWFTDAEYGASRLEPNENWRNFGIYNGEEEVYPGWVSPVSMPWWQLTPNAGAWSEAPNQIYQDTDGNFWFRGPNYVARSLLDDLSTWTFWEPGQEGLPWLFDSLGEDSLGNIWIGNEYALSRLDETQWIDTPIGIPQFAPIRLEQGDDGELYAVRVATVYHVAGDTITQLYSTPDEYGSIHDLEVDAAGNHWIGTPEGLLYWDGAALSVYTPDNSAMSDLAVEDIAIRPSDGLVAVATTQQTIPPYTGGVALHDPATGEWIAYNHGSSFLPHYGVGDMQFDADGHLWIGVLNYGTVQVLIGEDHVTPIPGDLNGDQLVDEQDRAALCSALGTSQGDPAFLEAADFDANGTIDHLDQQAFNDLLPPCAGDVVSSATFQPPADGVTNGADLAYLLGAWGAQPSCADFVSSRTFQPPPDGKVDGADLAFLLGAWGACE